MRHEVVSRLALHKDGGQALQKHGGQALQRRVNPGSIETHPQNWCW